MISHWLTVLGTPKAIYSDKGSHLTAACFRTMCRLMGLRHARTVAYRSQCKGRAEVAGRQLFEQLKKFHLKRPGRNWLTSMWLPSRHTTTWRHPPGTLPTRSFLGGTGLSKVYRG